MAKELWQQTAEKIGGKDLVDVISAIKDGQDDIIERMELMDNRYSASERAIDDLKKAFPSCDLEGHRRYHDMVVETLSERRRLRIAIQEKTISGLVWALILYLATAAWRQIINVLHN